ncbi:MAG TPA: hypothetical protein VD908_06705 [Cytophagales bacterium]|nr:hypothetical protein [Cytophagales bacterium]
MKPFHLLVFILLASCDPYDFEYKSEYQAILMTRNQLEKSVVYQQPRAFINTGKIYQKGYYIFINEKYKGVHIIDNHDPTSPQNIGFISAPGCIDMAVKGNSLYMDNALDLVAVDITNFEHVTVTERIKDVFPELLPPDSEGIPEEFTTSQRPQNTIIVGWEKKAN